MKLIIAYFLCVLYGLIGGIVIQEYIINDFLVFLITSCASIITVATLGYEE